MTDHQDQRRTALERRRELRAQSTESESLLWRVLKARRLCGLKFRRQHSIDPYIVDFACIEHRLIVELDGAYHELVFKPDRIRQLWLEALGSKVLRFRNEDVLDNVEGVATAVAREVGLDPMFGEHCLYCSLSPPK